MHRSMMQVYVKNSQEALTFYEKAFGAKIVCCYYNENGTIAHAELDIFGQIFAISETQEDDVVTGNSMQFCLHFGDGKEDIVRKIYHSLKDGAKIHYPLSPCDYSPLMVGLIDKYGVNWCIFV